MSNLSNLFDRYKALVVFDTETSGLDFDSDQIIELAALRVERTATGGLRIAGKMDTFIKLPEGETLPENIVSLTGITDERLQTEGVQPTKAASQIAKLMQNGPTLMIAHNAQFDACFLRGLLRGQKVGRIDWLDSLTVYKDRRAYPHKLANAIIAYDLTGKVQNSHRAIDDVLALFEVLKAMDDERKDLGSYVIRKLTPTECERLQTLPDGYTSAVSATQRYRGLGNGWTAEVIIHILTGALKDVPRDEEIVVLSMYDGIGTGRYCLDKMGFTNVTYYAYEIDKPAMTVALSNYPDIIQLGDAFDLRRDDWELGKRFERTAEQKAEAPESPDQTTDLSDAPEEIKEQIIENDRALKEKDSTAPAPPPEGFDVVDQLSELLAERKKLHIIDEENLRYNCDIIALEYAIGALRR